MANVIVVLIVVLILGVSITYIVKAKTAGVKCIGCPAGTACSGNCSGCSGNCTGHLEE